MARFGLCGGFYTLSSFTADCQACINLYPEVVESGSGKSNMILLGTPGLSAFTTLPASPVRGQLEINGRYFAVGGSSFCEISSAGVVTVRGAVTVDSLPASLAAGLGIILIASGGNCYSFTLATNTFAQLDTTSGAALQASVLQVGATDGYFIALLEDGRLQLSDLISANFNPLNIATVSVTAGTIIGMVVDHREVWFFGNRAIVPYSDTGNPLFPFELIQGAFIESGTAASFGQVKADNTICWIASDERGNGMAFRAQGYSPVRVSTFAIENEWRGYPTIADAIGYAYQESGHTFVCWYFPTANKTWLYDVSTWAWHERRSRIGQTDGAHFSQNHAFAFGKHLVGDWNSAKIYQMGLQFLDDNSAIIRRVRRAPHVSEENTWMFHHSLEIDIDSAVQAVTPLVDGDGNPRGALMMMRYSDDGGFTWRNELLADMGKPGEYKKRVQYRRLGRSRDRVYEISVSDPVRVAIVDGYLDASPGFGPTPRLSSQLRKGA